MSSKRPYPESYLPVHHRAARVAAVGHDRVAVLSEPGFLEPSRVCLHLCPAAPAQEGLAGPGLTLVGPEAAVFVCKETSPLVAGLWNDRGGRLLLAWSDGEGLHVKRSLRGVEGIERPEGWESLSVALPGHAGRWHLGSGAIHPSDGSLWLAALEEPSGGIVAAVAGGRGQAGVVLDENPLNHSPTLALSPDGATLHVVWDTEDLRILYRAAAAADVRAGRVQEQAPVEVWTYCHHPDVAATDSGVVVAYTDHMHNIKFASLHGSEWRRNRFVTVQHPRFAETLEHSPTLWTDQWGRVHLRFVCLTRRLAYDALWLGEDFADPQPVEGLFHPSLFNDDVRVPAERMSVDRGSGAMVLSSTFLPERHGVYQSTRVPSDLAVDEPVLFLDLAETAELRGLWPALVPMENDPVGPVFEPTEGPSDFDGARVLNNGTVLRDRGRCRMWYSAMALDTAPAMNWYDFMFVGYAESDDGLHWRRADTGLGHTFRCRPAPGLIRELDHNACVFVDPEDEPARRYKAIKFESRAQRYDRASREQEPGYLGLPRRAWLCTSGDGIRWAREEVTVDFPGPEPYGFQPQKALYDPHDPDPGRRYKTIGFTSLVGRRRGATLAYSADCRHWVVAERSPLLDSMAAVSPVRPAGPYAQIHDATMARYGRYLFAFYQNQFDGEQADVRLAVSRDGERFHYVFPEIPLLAQGEPGSWDSGYVMPADLMEAGDELWLFHGSSRHEPDAANTGIPAPRVCAGRAVARRDGFVRVSPTSAGEPGWLVTIPFRPTGAGPLRLEVNAALGHDSELRVALAGPGLPVVPLPGYAIDDAAPIRGDSTAHRARWAGREVLPAAAEGFRICLLLHGSPDDAMYSVTLRSAAG